MRVAVLVALALAAVVMAASQRVEKEADRNVNYMPPGWVKLEKQPPRDHVLRLQIMAKQRNAALLHATVLDVANVHSPNYGKWLTHQQVIDLVHPTDETLQAIDNWLAAHNIAVDDRIATGDIITIRPTVAQAELLLNTHFALFHHPETDTIIVKADAAYSVPMEVAAHVDLVVGVTNIPRVWAERNSAHNLEARQAAAEIGPKELRARYNVSVVGSNSNNSQAVAEFQAQYYSPKDLSAFFRKYVDNSGNDTVYKVVGSNNPGAPGVEASLDIQYIMGVAPNVQTWFYSYPSMEFFDDVTAWLGYLSNQSDIPLVHSVSYGDQTMAQPSSSYKTATETQFAKVTGRGVSIIFASGDSGSGCDICIWLQPSYPATSVYVTSVGATQFMSGSTGPEEAVTAFSSGGGFSWDWDAPSWQQTAVNNYLSTYSKDMPFGFMYNAKGRATPDVAALGIGFAVEVAGGIENIGGTSASAPTFSAIVSLLNDARLNAGQPPLGFLNSWIYDTAANVHGAFFDVTVGGDPDSCCLFPFPCEPGYDAVTGVGTPNFEVLVLNMPQAK